MEDVFYFPKWSFDSRNELVSDIETRLPRCDMEDLGDKYDYCRSSGNSKGQDHS
ncbi:MAG TPA: hypothetical protein VFG90_00785 [Nitrososphaeraceae archaeon]|nr:hypothetical protein [Nitrososphaeraceae archaeon]